MITAAELRQRVVDAAAREEGSVDALKYWHEVLPRDWHGPHPPHWCGAFTLWALRTVLECPWTWEVGRGYLYRLKTSTDPDLGDICYMAQPYQHHAVLTAVGTSSDGVPFVISQDGNSGPSPGMCLEQWRSRSKWTAFYSIEPLVQRYLENHPNG